MLNLMDIIVVLIILCVGFFGYKKGFVKTIISLIAFFVAVGLALAFYKPLAKTIAENSQIDDWIIEKIVTAEFNTNLDDDTNQQNVANENVTNENVTNEDITNENITNENTNSLESNNNNGIPDYFVDFLNSLPSSFIDDFNFEEAKENAKEEFAEKVAELFLNLLSLIAIYIVVRVILLIAMYIVDGIMHIPVLKQLNEVLGLIAGLILGVMQVYIVFAVLTFISSVCDISFIINAIKASMFARILFENNIIIGLLF